MSNVTTLGIDLAKEVFQLHGVNQMGKAVLKKRLKRAELAAFIQNFPPCTIGIEACGSAHYWARQFIKMGHTVKMIAPQFVKPYLRGSKNDKNDAAAIAEAASRPDIKCVPIKTLEQQDILLLHRARELAVKQRTAQSNQIRGLLAEYGIVLPQGIKHIYARLPEILEDGDNPLTPMARAIFNEFYETLRTLDEKIDSLDTQIHAIAKNDERCKRLMEIEGVGPIIATAIVAAVGNASVFKSAREFAAWLGLIPKQHSSGGKIRLMGITKRGDKYLRKLLVQGARSIVNRCATKATPRLEWVFNRMNGPGAKNKAAVALANKNARIIWALLARKEAYRSTRDTRETIAA